MPPTYLLYNATILTQDPRRPRGGLVLIREGRIAYVGEAFERERLLGLGVVAVDCHGGAVLPGFHDTHLHLLALAARLQGVDCSPGQVSSIRDLQEAIARRAREAPHGAWIRAWGYDDFALAEGRHPTAADLDAAAPEHPVRLNHRSGHACVLNSPALRLAGITRDTPDPPEGVVERDEHGAPTGLLLEMEAYLDARLPRSPVEELEDGVRRASWLLRTLGVTAVQDATHTNDLSRWELFVRLMGRGLLSQRVTFMPGARHLRSFRQAGLSSGAGDASLRLGPLKVMLTATTGALVPSPEELADLTLEAARARFPVAVHAVEAQAVQAAAKAIALAARATPGQALRHRIEHASECPPEVLAQVAGSGALVVTNPTFLYHSGRRYLAQVPKAMQPWLYRIGALRQSGVAVAFGSDAPVDLPDPRLALYAAVTRRAASGEALSPSEAIPVEDALAMTTRQGALAAGREGEMGTLQRGMLADLVVMDRDPTQVEAEALKELRVQIVFIGGELVWEG